MIRVNLLPLREIKAEVGRRRDMTIAGLTVGVTAIALAGVYFYQSYRLSKLGDELAGLRTEIQALNLKVKEIGDLQDRIKEFRSKHKVIEDLNKKKIGPVRVMESLSSATPASLWLTEFRETKGTLVINGLAVDNQTIADFLKGLANSTYFKDVELVETAQADEKTGPYKKFSIRGGVSYQEPASTEGAKTKGNVGAKEGKKG